MHPSLSVGRSVGRSIVRESPKLLKESGRQKRKERGQGPLLCVVLGCASLASSLAISLGNRKPKKEKVEEERRREEIGFFFVYPAHSFSRHGFVVAKIPGAFCLLDLSFFLASSGFSVPCQTVVIRSHSW